jgi:hypothetical protein
MHKPGGHWGISSFGRAPALHAGGKGFDSPILHSLFANSEYSSIAQSVERLTVNQNVPGSSPGGGVRVKEDAMSLLSQKDRDMVITALEYFILSLKTYKGEVDEGRIAEYHALVNWVKLEKFKHETLDAVES